MDFMRSIVENELSTDETLIWVDKPIAKPITAGGIIASVFGLIFTSFSLFWTITALENSRNDYFFRQSIIDKIFPFFGLIFLIVGIGLLLSPVWIYKNSKNTTYAITNKRCLIIVSGHTKKVSSYSKDRLTILEKVEHNDGTGDIIFSKEAYTSTNSDTNSSEIRYRNIGFHSIQNVRVVEQHIKGLFL